MIKKLQFYKYATVALLVLNLTLIAVFFLTKPKALPLDQDVIRKTEDLLELDKKQQDSYLNLSAQHVRQMENFNDQQSYLLKPYFNALTDKNANIDAENLLNKIADLERKKIESTYKHLEGILSILKPEQQVNFNQYKDQAIELVVLGNN